jgi:phospholipase C
VSPYLTTAEPTIGGPHNSGATVVDIDGGKMDGFLTEFRQQIGDGPTDVMAHWDAQTIPNYWAYASNFVLQDHMFQPVGSWSHPSHLYEVSAWSATCTSTNPFS